MSRLAQLKKSKGANLKAMQEKLEKASGGGYQRDERVWTPTFNKDKGKGVAIVRLLPPESGDPFVEVKRYSIEGPGGKYYDMARDTVGEEDPIKICYINMFKKAKAEGDDALKAKAKTYQPKSKFYANVLVIKDEEKPENNGKVMIYEFGYQIYKIITAKLKPEFDDIVAQDVFCPIDGSDLIIRMVSKEMPDARTGKKIIVPNYEKSEFSSPAIMLDGDETAIEAVLAQTHDLMPLIDKSLVKSFDEVAEKFKKVTGRAYNYLSEGGLEEHVAEQSEKLKEDLSNQDESDTSVEDDDDTPPFDMSDSNTDEDEDPVAKFMRLAKG